MLDLAVDDSSSLSKAGRCLEKLLWNEAYFRRRTDDDFFFHHEESLSLEYDLCDAGPPDSPWRAKLLLDCLKLDSS
jgi:hypothetical protein